MTDAKSRHLMAVMFTDVVGYTALMQDDEDAARDQRARHRAVLGATVAEHGGELLQYFGDGSLSIFPSAVNALRAAVRIQQDAQREPGLPLRIGIHQGEVSFDSQGAYGDSVNIAARIEALGVPGSVLISGKVHDDVKNQPAMSTLLLGLFALRNVQRPVEVYAVAADGLTVPSTEQLRGAKGGDLLEPAPSARALTGGPVRTGGIGRLVSDRMLLVTSAVALLFALAFAWTRFREPARALARFDVTPPEGRSLLPNVSGVDIALGPGGDRLVYVGEAGGGTQLWTRTLAELRPSPVPGTANARDPVFAPDGSALAFRAGESLRTVSLDGGPSGTLVPRGLSGGPDWGDDGFLYFPSGGVLQRIAAHGGEPEAWTPPTDGVQRFPQALPGGRGVLFTIESPGTPERGTVAAWIPGEDTVRTLVTGTRGRYVDPGFLLFSTADGALRAAPFDLRRLRITGPSVVLLDDDDLRGGPASKFVLSRQGDLLYRTGVVDPIAMRFMWVSLSGAAEPVDPEWIFDPGQDNRGWSLSPDGTRIALKAVTDLGPDIWIKSVPDGPLSRFTYSEGEERMPRWSPDGTHVSFLSDRNGNLDLWRRAADGRDTASVVVDMEQSIAEAAWSRDGTAVVLRTAGAAGIVGNRDLFVFRPGLDTVPAPLVASPFDEAAPALSPDGRWLAYHSDETGRREVFVRPFPDVGSGKFQISDGGGRGAVWAHGGNAIFYVSDEGGTNVGTRLLVEASVDAGPPFTVLERRPLFRIEDSFYFANNSTSYQVAPGDDRFLMARYVGSGARVEMVLVQGFTQELARLSRR